ncbi:sterol O-acyltransferase 2-like [Halichondria panicea]|uniref:sterol O-acyltransferase 2-like n=1 Tax=Halichondria panicea TaxID=6063 RepID=UPI00312B45AA
MPVRVKVFKDRKSLFIQLLEGSQHFGGLWNIVLIQFGIMAVVLTARDVVSSGGFDLRVETHMFGGPMDWLRFTLLEILLISGALLIYPSFMIWQRLRKFAGGVIDRLFLLTYLAMVGVTMVAVFKSLTLLDLPPVFRSLSTIEHMRLVMKSYSFIRENSTKLLSPWHKDDEDGPSVWYERQMDPSVGSFSKYFYFLFVPTLLYRDHYPRLKGPICWRNVVFYFGQFLAFTYVHFVIYGKWLVPASFKPQDLWNTYQYTLMTVSLGIVSVNVIIFHSWHNFTAELTRFADREFYTDWWNSSSYPIFYRKWNVLIYDWLNAYFYQDLRKVLKSSWLTALVVFLVSSFMHDYHIAVATRYFLPVFMVFFAGGGGFMFLVRPDKNSRFAKAFTVWGFYVGTTIIVCAHYTEVAARTACPQVNSSYLQYATLACFSQHNITVF